MRSQYANFSVIISFYLHDRADWAACAIKSIYNQSVCPKELIVTIDGPISASLREYLFFDLLAMDVNINVSFIEFKINKGRGVILAKAINAAIFPIVAIMDADDESLPDRFEKQLGVLDRYPEIDVVGSSIDEFDIYLEEALSIKKLPEDHLALQKYARWRNPINQMTVMFRKEAVIEAGNYQNFYLLEDYWLWARMIKNGFCFYNLNCSLVRVRAGIDQVQRRKGMRYLKSEILFAHSAIEIGFFSKPHALIWVVVRMILRVLPANVLSYFYSYILR